MELGVTVDTLVVGIVVEKTLSMAGGFVSEEEESVREDSGS